MHSTNICAMNESATDNEWTWPRDPLTVGTVSPGIAFLRLLLQKPDVPESAIERVLGALLNRYPVSAKDLTLVGAWRAQINQPGERFGNVARLWYPPAANVTCPGRLNEAGHSVFYCSMRQEAAAEEVGAKPGDEVSLLAVGLKGSVSALRVAPVGVDRASARVRQVMDWKPSRGDQRLRELLGTRLAWRKWCEIDDLLGELLAANPGCAGSHPYVVTNVIARWLWRMPPNPTPLDGILFPSAASELNQMNLCLSAEAADRCLRPLAAYVFRVHQGAVGGRELNAELVAVASAIAPDGAITWREAPGRHEAPERSLAFIRSAAGPVWTRQGLTMSIGPPAPPPTEPGTEAA
jgi:hypothetical protein